VLVLPPPQPAVANPKTTIIASALASARRLGCVVEADLPLSASEKSAIATVSRVNTPETGNRNGRVRSAKGRAAAAPVVVTITVNGVAVPPETWRFDGPWMLAPVGAPLYASATLPE